MRCWLTTIVLYTAATGAIAQGGDGPKVLHDTGLTKPLAPFYARVKAKVEPLPPVSTVIPAHGLRLPIRSRTMSVGTVNRRPLARINRHMPRSAMRPLFLFGADQQSLHWVSKNRERFREVRAVGMLVSATTDEDVEAAQQAVGDIPFFGGSADAIAQALKLYHYPVLITPAGVSL